MDRRFRLFLFVVAVLLGPVFFWCLGPMLFWPLARMYLSVDDRRIGYFYKIFQANLLFVVGGSLLVGLLIFNGTPDAIYYLAIPYSIGVILLIAAIAVSFVGGDRKA